MKMKIKVNCFSLLILSSFAGRTSAQNVNLVPAVDSISIVDQSFGKSDCAVVEGSLGNNIEALPTKKGAPFWKGQLNRRLLRFSTWVINEGTDDLKVCDRATCPDWFEW
jgi:hypothetical protein